MQFSPIIEKKLTARQLEVAKLMVLGYTYYQISSKLRISEMTVKIHIRDIHSKIGAKNRTHAAYILGLKTKISIMAAKIIETSQSL